MDSKKVTPWRRIVAAALMILIFSLALTGCRPLVPESDQVSVYATFYPIYALTDAVTRDVPDMTLHCLIQPQDGCLRSYALSDWDASILSSGADAVIAGGRGLESFESTLFGWGESGPAISAVLYNLELYNQKENAANVETESHLKGQNPHLYMSVDGAKEIVESISAAMVSMDPQYSQVYIRNAEAAKAELDALLMENREALSEYRGSSVILMNEALIYVALNYGLEVADWIDRESGAAMGDNELADCLQRLSTADANVILIEKQAPQALVDALEAAGYAVARLDVLSTHREGEGFDAYIEIQSANAQSIREAFERERDGKEEH